MKNNLTYYKHRVDSHNHWKFKTLRKKYKWEGEGKFWALNNMIAESEHCVLDMTQESKKKAIAVELDFEPAELDQFVEFLVKECDLLEAVEGGFTTNMVQEIFSEVSNKRNYAKERVRRKRQEFAETIKKLPETNNSEQKSSVEHLTDKSKEDKIRVKKIIRPKGLLSSAEDEQQEDLKKSYEKLAEEIGQKDSREIFKAIRDFVTTGKPAFAEPYVDAWNLFAPANGLERVKTITPDRRNKIRIRVREPEFDFFKILSSIRQNNFYRGENNRGWKVEFNYVIESQAKYVPILERFKDSQ